MKPSDWHKDFLLSRDLSSVTGKPLYSYNMKEHEYASLTEVLKNNSYTAMDWDSCLVFYAVEWWRKEYSGGHWSWEPIFNSINQSDSIQVLDRNRMVERGFSRWNRSIYQSHSGREFLGTVVIECGIPLNILRDDHYLAEIISETYREVGGISSIEYEHFDLVRSIANRRRLPETLNKEPFIQLILETVQKLVKLNHEYELSKHESPVSFLDSQFATWREEFPVRIDNEVAKKFLDNLLSEVSKIEMPSGSSISIICELESKESTWQSVSYLSIKSGIHRYQNLGLKEDTYNQLSNKAELFIDDEKGERRIGFAFKVFQKDGFRIDGLEKYRLVNSNPFSLFLSDSKSGQRIDIETPANILLFDEPLIFSKKDSKWILKATGSAKVPDATYRIIVQSNSQLVCEEFEVIGLLPENKKIIEIRSECEILNDDNLYKIRFANQSQTYRYEIHPSDNYHTIDFYRKENQNVYLGFPKIYQFDENGNLSSRIISGVEYYNGHQWKSLNPNEKIVGNLKIRLTKEGETLFCRSISILPKDFRVEFMINGAGSSTRKVTIHNSSALLLTIKSQVQSKMHAEHQDRHIIEFIESPDVDIPESFQMKLQSNAFSDEVELRIPYPLNEFYFYDTSGQVLNNRQNLFLQKLHGVRLAIPNHSNKSVTNTLHLKLVDRFLDEAVQIGKPIKKEPLSGNIPLIRFQDQISMLFSLTENIDARVEVSCQQKLVEIRQFSSKPRFITENKTVSIKTTEVEIHTVDAKAIRLDLPFSKDQIDDLNHVSNGEWELPEGEGVWLIYPGCDSSQLFRPIAYKTIPEGNVEVFSVDEIHQSAILPREQRLEALGQVIDQMCTDFNHPDWNRLHELYKETKHLPLATIDIWKVFAHHDLGLIGLALRLPKEIIKQLTEEFSIIWYQISIDKWVECFNRYKNYVQEHYPEQSEFLLNYTLDHIDNMLELPSVRWMLEGNNQSIPHDTLKSLVLEKLNGKEGSPGVRGRHDQEKWPDQLKDKLISSFIQLPQEIRHLLPLPQSIHSYQQPVIYLPFILAVASTTSLIQLPEFSAIERFRMMKITDFDEAWFKEIYFYVRCYTWAQFTPKKVNS
jgi:hypothetical protein